MKKSYISPVIKALEIGSLTPIAQSGTANTYVIQESDDNGGVDIKFPSWGAGTESGNERDQSNFM